ncbi:unnamed protein product [Clavelina lepadiformis]|uniref:Protein TBATA n=1 Tax=Clavelina lepadiformis TaxID=159417 RepID=A0ABP0GYM6_CLALP
MIASVQRPSSSFSVFKPDNKPLVVRSTLGDVFETSKPGSRIKKKKRKLLSDVPAPAVPPLESNLNLPLPPRLSTGSAKRPDSKLGSRFGAYSQASFFSRHNPHPVRVRHIEGLNGVPICAVHDDGYFPLPRIGIATPSTRERENFIKNYVSSTALGINSTKFPINTITGLQNYPFKEKAVPRIGLIPITDSWRNELRELCTKAGLVSDEQPAPYKPASQTVPHPMTPARKTLYSAQTGRVIPPPSRAMSRQSVRNESSLSRHINQHYSHITAFPDTETLMLEMLCQILQTDSIPSVQQWLVSSGDREKTLVLDLIKNAMNQEETILREEMRQEAAAIKTPLPRSRAGTAPKPEFLETDLPAEDDIIGRIKSSTPRPMSKLSRRSLSRSSLGKRTPAPSPAPEIQATMRFNKGSAASQRLPPLPKIDEGEEEKENLGIAEEAEVDAKGN